MLGYLLLLIGLFGLIFVLVNNMKIGKIEKKIIDLVGNINSKYEQRIIEAKESSYIKKNKNKKLDYLDDLIIRTKVREYAPFFTSEILILISIVVAIVFFIAVNSISKNQILKVEAIILGLMLPSLIMEQIATNVFDSIDDKILLFIDTAINFSTSKNELLFILENTAEYLTGPLKAIISQLANELKRGVPLHVAFENAASKTDNVRLKEILKNLCIVAQEDADYKGTLESARNIHERFYEQKMKGKRKVNDGKKGLIMLVIVEIFVLIGLNGFSSNLIGMLEDTLQGQLIVAYFGLIGILIVNKYFKINKFNS
ncbi:type II secretion system F family protein [Clostridium sulfidigenes]|uniref:type II secretion system F family protein n=1 Tax=Clostridium sulfidigenes TaxID=318464 RepID=UPI003F888317